MDAWAFHSCSVRPYGATSAAAVTAESAHTTTFSLLLACTIATASSTTTYDKLYSAAILRIEACSGAGRKYEIALELRLLVLVRG